jgi:hypothetical protein
VGQGGAMFPAATGGAGRGQPLEAPQLTQGSLESLQALPLVFPPPPPPPDATNGVTQ